MTASRKPRVRRAPEDARVHILDAADAVFARELPDAVGLRDIAEEAGVSHGLVTHYFGTYDGVIAAAIDRRLARAQETAFARLAQLTFAADEIPLLGVLTDLLADRTLTRLVVWSFLTGRDSAVMRKDAQLGRLVDLMHARLTAIGVAIPRAPRAVDPDLDHLGDRLVDRRAGARARDGPRRGPVGDRATRRAPADAARVPDDLIIVTYGNMTHLRERDEPAVCCT
jgi:AcrR family transcriptional regulator